MAQSKAIRTLQNPVEEKIDRALRLGLTYLDLSKLQLTELPASIRRLEQLNYLDVSSNNLTALPVWIGEFTFLLDLYADDNKLESIPSTISLLSKLTYLTLSKNQLTCLPNSIGQLKNLKTLYAYHNKLVSLPESIGQMSELETLSVFENQLTTLPDSFDHLKLLKDLDISGNNFTVVPECIKELRKLRRLSLTRNLPSPIPDWIYKFKKLKELGLPDGQLPAGVGQLKKLNTLVFRYNNVKALPDWIRQLSELEELAGLFNKINELPEWISELKKLKRLHLRGNKITNLPLSLSQLPLEELDLDDNPLNPELAAAYKEGIDAVMKYLRAKGEAQVALNEAKLILVGEGEVGKSCLLGALRGDPFAEGRPTTHGIEIKPIQVADPVTGTTITLNGWDFGGQRVYRPTHQLFFSAPAVYLVVWKPREGPQQGLVREWIQLIKHREPDAKIIVVATHGGPGQRQPDIDKQELWDLFGKDMVISFVLVDSKPNETGECPGIAELRTEIAKIAANLPEMGRKVPARWQKAREILQKTGEAYLSLEKFIEICRECSMQEDEARLFATISHRLGHLIHYQHDPSLRDIVILKPDWLSTAMSFVLDDKQTREGHGLVTFARLSELWSDTTRAHEFRYLPQLHQIFLRLMERFDLSYRVAEPHDSSQSGGTSLIAQLVPDVRPDPMPGWEVTKNENDAEQAQICRVVDAKTGQSGLAEGLFYRLIVRLHKFSLGRNDYNQSVHWQRGLVLDDDYNGRALLENVGNDVRITVRAAYPERFLSVLTNEVKWLIENSWAGLRCEVMVPCVEPCGKQVPGTGLFDVQKLITFRRQGMKLFPCIVNNCAQAQDIDHLLRNAPVAQRLSIEQLVASFAVVKDELASIRNQMLQQYGDAVQRFNNLDVASQRTLSRIDDAYTGLMQAYTDEAKDGPRLFSFHPVEPGFFDKPKWISAKFELTLWCEHSRLPLHSINGNHDRTGVYELSIPRDWFVKAAPFLKILAGTLSAVLPVASTATKLIMDDQVYKQIEKELEFGQKSLQSAVKIGESAGEWLASHDALNLEGNNKVVRGDGAILRQLHSWLKEKDPGFGGLVRVQNKRQEFLWVHPKFESEY